MSHPAATHATLDEWIARESISFSLDSPSAFNAAVARVVDAVGESLELLAFGEALHGGEELLVLRNRLFQRLVEAHGYTAIAVESSFPRGRVVNDYLAGREASYDAVREAGFSHGFGRLDANRELIEWMRQYNANAAHAAKLTFYGFDSPTEMTGADSPRQLLHVVLDYLAPAGGATGDDRRGRIDELLGDEADWLNPAAMMDPLKSIGLSPAATALRIETEELISELALRRPEIPEGEEGRYLDAWHHAVMARQLLNYHAAYARPSPTRIADLLGLRDLTMADTLLHAAARERSRGGRLLAFAHNSHLKRGRAQWQMGPHALAWWPAGAHLSATLGSRYVVIGSGLGTSDANGIGEPEPGTLEARLTAAPGPARFIPTHRGNSLPASIVTDLPTRSASRKNAGYFPLTAQSFTDFDWLVVLDFSTYARGGPPLP